MAKRCHRITGRLAAMAFGCGLAFLAGSGFGLAEEQPTEAQILDALKSRAPARNVTAGLPAADGPAADERRFIESLLKKPLRSITPDERRKVLEIASDKPNINLEIPFDFNSAVIGPPAVPALTRLGRALTAPELASVTFLIAGHTDAKGSDSYNQDLSERRAEAVKRYLAEQFKLAPEQLLAIGFGKTKLKNAVDPFAGENRRVQIVNTELK